MTTLLYSRLQIRPYKNYVIVKDIKTDFTEVVSKKSLQDKMRIVIYDKINTDIKKHEYYIKVTKQKDKLIFNETDNKLTKHILISSYDELKKACSYKTQPTEFILDTPLLSFVKPSRLTALKKDIKERCPELTLVFDYAYKIHEEIRSFASHIIIGLIYKEKIISEVAIYTPYFGSKNKHSMIKKDMIENNVIEIVSHTKNEYQERKYNILIRAIVIILSKYINNTTMVVSYAVNPVSVWTMMKYFNAIPDDKFKTFIDGNFTLKKIKEYYEHNYMVTCVVPVAEEYIKRAWEVYYAVLEKDSSLKCP